jgi:K319-like protein/HYDIN/CFA65/VesB family protein/ASPM-SPD-2-Hydin domain-containing protein/centrosomal CEP192-like protein
MKKWVVILLVLITRTASAFLCVEPILPVLEINPTGLDFGSAPIGGSKTLTFTLTYHSERFYDSGVCSCRCANPDHADLTLSLPASSSYSVNTSSLTLADGASATISVTFRPNGAQGIYSDSLTIHSSSRTDPYTVTLTGVAFNGQGNIDFNPLSLNFGNVETGTTKSLTVSISNSGTSTLTGSLSTAAPFSAPTTPFSIAPGGTIIETIRFTPAALGDVTGVLDVTSNDPDAGHVSLSLMGKGIQRYISVQPSSLDFGTIPSGETRTKTLTIANTSCTTCDDAAILALSYFSVSGDGFTFAPPAQTTLGPGESTTMTVTLLPASSGAKNATLTFHTSDPSVPSVSVSAQGTLVNTQYLDPSATSVFFGDVHLGTTGNQSFSIRNKSSSGTLVISNVASTTSRVTVSPTSVTLGPGATQTFQAHYAPTATNATTLWNEVLNAGITVTSNDSGLSTMTLETTGRGISPVISVSPIDGVWNGAMIDLGTLYSGDSRVFLLKVSNSGNETLNVPTVTTSLPALSPQTTSLTVSPQSSAQIGVLYHPMTEGTSNATLTFSSNDFFTPTDAVALTGASVSQLNLSVSKLESTQSIQKLDTALSLVAAKATTVRTFISSTIRGVANTSNVIRKVDGLLHLFKNGSEVAGSPFQSVNGPIDVVPSPDRAKAGDTLNFLIPAGVLATNDTDHWQATVEINPASGARSPRLLENRFDDNTLSQALTFYDTYQPLIYYVPMSIKGYPLPPDELMVQGKRLMEKIFPVASVRYVRRPPIALNMDVTMDNVAKVLQALFFASHLGASVPPDRTYGWFPINYSAPDFRGYSEGIPGRTAVGGGLSSAQSAQETFAHEMGHTYGLCHTNATVSESCPLGYTDDHLPTYEDVPEIGFDVDTQQTVLASKDIMTTKTLSQRWIHPQRYQFLFQRLLTQAADPADARGLCTLRPSACQSLFQPVQLVSGSFADDGTADLHPVISASSIPDDIPQDFGTAYAVRLVDADGNILLEYPLDAASETGLDGSPVHEHVFSFAVPDLEGLEAIQVIQGDTVLAERRRSAHAPTLTLNPPTVTDVLAVSWQASDEDGDPLLYSVLYSIDGGLSFQTIGVDLTATTFAYDASKLPGGSAVVRVIANDGFHTVSQDSAPFAVPTKPPVVAILSPTDGQTIFAGSKISAEAEADDAEDGALDGESLQWSSDLAGSLGTGRTLALTLPAGHHTLTITAKDKDGHTSSKTAAVYVVDGTQSPRANAGNDQKVAEGSSVTLDGSLSSDPDGDALTFEWVQVEGPSAALDDKSSITPSFVAPQVTEDTDLKFRLTVTDPSGHVGTAFVTILAENVFYPSLHFSDALIDFGIADVGKEISRTVTVSNQGNEDLIVTGVESSRADFSADASPFTLAPGESRDVTLYFKPTEEAIFDSNLRFVSNTVAGVPTRVFVKGATPHPKAHYDDNGLGASLLPSDGLSASESPAPDGSPGGAATAGGCSLIR